MARKVFISFLGTNNYLRTHYQIGECKATRFIQEALTDTLCNDWTDNDRIFIFYTQESYKKNWLDNGQTNSIEAGDDIGLQSILTSKKYAKIVEGTLIKEGFSESEIWDIFNTVYDKLQENDEIHFDVTHAFRSIPMFSTVLFNFSQFLKNTSLKSVHYGAFEKLGPSYLVKNIPVEDRKAPVIDLTNLIELQNLTQTASAFIEYGKIGKIGRMINFSSDEKGTLKQALNKLKIEIDKLEDYIVTNRIKDIVQGKFIEVINTSIKKLSESKEITKAEIEVLNKLKQKISCFSPNSENNVLAAINWAYEFDMIPQAYTLGQEHIITLVCEKYSEFNFYSKTEDDDKKSNIKFRTYISSILGISNKNIEEGKIERPIPDNMELFNSLIKDEKIQALRTHYSLLASNRNILNHAKNSNLSINQYKQQFNDCYYSCLNILKSC